MFRHDFLYTVLFFPVSFVLFPSWNPEYFSFYSRLSYYRFWTRQVQQRYTRSTGNGETKVSDGSENKPSMAWLRVREFAYEVAYGSLFQWGRAKNKNCTLMRERAKEENIKKHTLMWKKVASFCDRVEKSAWACQKSIARSRVGVECGDNAEYSQNVWTFTCMCVRWDYNSNDERPKGVLATKFCSVIDMSRI